MSDDKNLGVDPRFDPAFQRGFDPTIPIEEYRPNPLLRETAAPPPQGTPRADVWATALSVTDLPAPELNWADGENDADGLENFAAEPESNSSPLRNPFLLLLGIIAIALVTAGIWLFVRSGDAFNRNGVRSQGDYMSLDAAIHTAPLIALLGIATAIGVLFVFASSWRARR